LSFLHIQKNLEYSKIDDACYRGYGGWSVSIEYGATIRERRAREAGVIAL